MLRWCLAVLLLPSFAFRISKAQVSNPPRPQVPSLTLGLVKRSALGTSNPNNVPEGIKIESLAEASTEQKVRTAEGFAYANKVLASAEFKQAVLAMNVPVCFQTNYYHDDFAFSNQAVYDLLVASSPLNLNVVWYDGVGNNEGYEVEVFKNTVGANRIAVERAGNSRAHPTDTKEQKEAGFVATLSMHETSHVLGFPHPPCRHHQITESIPYVFNQIYWDLAPKLAVPQQ
jgi:hypothetical protein